MKPQRTSADPRLLFLLEALVKFDVLPPLDRWFSRWARDSHWTGADQKHLWDALRRALTRAYSLSAAMTPEQTQWKGVSAALGRKSGEWAQRSWLSAAASPTPVMAGIPAWLVPAFEDRAARSRWTNAERRGFLLAQETPAPVYVRFRDGALGAAARQRLERSGEAGSGVEGIGVLTGHRSLVSGPDWNAGHVEIQDAASQLSLRRLDLRPGMRVWDVCAGQGGKTLLAASELKGKGALVATDVSEPKLRSLRERVRRSGWQNIRIYAWDGVTPPSFGKEVLDRGGFDRVIVDAPCSAAGTWRRDPDGRFRVSPAALGELHTHQERLLRLGWNSLKRGGRLAYLTCSWLPSEDEEVVSAFVAESGARLLSEELLGLPAFDANTLYAAVLEKP